MLHAIMMSLSVIVGLLQHALEAGLGWLALPLFPLVADSFPKGNEALLYLSADWDGTEGDIPTATWIQLDGFGTYNEDQTANITNNFMYGRTQAVSTIGNPGGTIALAGWYAKGDDGQDLLRSYGPRGANANNDLGFMYLLDGVDGDAWQVQVGGGSLSSNAEGGLHPVQYTLAPQSDPIAVTGFTGS